MDSQATINLGEVEIPQRELELKKHNEQCEHELKRLNDRLKIVLGDIAVMTIILEMTDCDAKLLQVKNFAVLQCEDCRTKKHFIKFNHKGLQEKAANKEKDRLNAAAQLADTRHERWLQVAEELKAAMELEAAAKAAMEEAMAAKEAMARGGKARRGGSSMRT